MVVIGDYVVLMTIEGEEMMFVNHRSRKVKVVR
jgi:hypothetical protein